MTKLINHKRNRSQLLLQAVWTNCDNMVEKHKRTRRNRTQRILHRSRDRPIGSLIGPHRIYPWLLYQHGETGNVEFRIKFKILQRSENAILPFNLCGGNRSA